MTLDEIEKQGRLKAHYKVWRLSRRTHIAWSAHEGPGGQWGFCYAPGLCLNVFLGARALSIQWVQIGMP